MNWNTIWYVECLENVQCLNWLGCEIIQPKPLRCVRQSIRLFSISNNVGRFQYQIPYYLMKICVIVLVYCWHNTSSWHHMHVDHFFLSPISISIFKFFQSFLLISRYVSLPKLSFNSSAFSCFLIFIVNSCLFWSFFSQSLLLFVCMYACFVTQ